MVKRLAILILLLMLAISPRIALGFQNERIAQQAIRDGNFKRAAEEFELAAQRLFWRGDLWNETGKAKLISGQREEAIIAYERAKEKDALSAFGWDILGQEHWNKGDHEGALAFWEKGLKHHPAYFELYTRLAMAYREKGDYISERDALENQLKNEEDLAFAHYRLGLLLILTSPESALDELTLAARADEKFAPVVETLRTSLNLALLESDPAEKMILHGRGLALAEEWQLASEVFYNATQAHPESASAWAWLGEAKQHLDEDAFPDLDNALNLDPDSTLVRSLRGLYWQRQGNLEEALDEFQAAARLEPENPNWQSALGEIYARLGDLPLALGAYEQSTILAPEAPQYWHLLALFSVQYAVQLEDVGLPAAQKALDLRPEDATFVDMLGWVYFDLERDKEAEEQFLYALQLDPNLSAAHLHLGMFYLKHSHRDLARQSLLQARELSQGDFFGKQAARLLEEYFKE
ncbi:MAG: tetratricopeptide repeat protein [Anaerolineae bacterium]|jgi:tetratricopeptide (TPR) repeat protein|nr:tetratricopeptide repeat protein [Anaerolineae bacterium]MBT3713681.1 tetratricopeptide repeat protein [Anaerolineae bacterium]MBT4310306.1 tetratricopeptide repeat protein [Anaerolineae bacterium]MBT4459767.1 tetratricopeptide repeat protein [Anaerolineae bacterium]MBT4840940.1 tetratricopeptide repeat protein [Anaerolineae bacterium]